MLLAVLPALSVLLCASGCRNEILYMRAPFDPEAVPRAPDYAFEQMWAALPLRQDPADLIPFNSGFDNRQDTAIADVFFLYPTIHSHNKRWNANVYRYFTKISADYTSIWHQASVFNGSCRIYAPRYRQISILVYNDTTEAYQQAVDVAYSDVKAAFRYYLEHYNRGRPFFLGGHSQGAQHLVRLINDTIAQDPGLRDRLIAAYCIGLPRHAQWPVLPLCSDSAQNHCVVTYNTFHHRVQRKGLPHNYFNQPGVVNPLTWRTDTTRAPYRLNQGSLTAFFIMRGPGLFDAQVMDSVLITNPRAYLGFLRILGSDYHVMDTYIYYANLRANLVTRLRAWLREHPQFAVEEHR